MSINILIIAIICERMKIGIRQHAQRLDGILGCRQREKEVGELFIFMHHKRYRLHVKQAIIAATSYRVD